MIRKSLPGSNRSTHRHKYRPGILETVEERVVPAVAPLQVISAAGVVTVAERQAIGGHIINVTVSGLAAGRNGYSADLLVKDERSSARLVHVRGMRELAVTGGTGADTITVTFKGKTPPADLRLAIRGNAGNDTLWTNNRNALIDGGPGVDTIQGVRETTTGGATVNLAEIAAGIIPLINQDRARAGASAVVRNALLDQAATLQAQQMLVYGYDHILPKAPLPEPPDRLNAVGYKYSLLGENIWQSDAAAEISAAIIMRVFEGSQGHFETIVFPFYTEVGIGLARGKTADGRDLITIVQVFARPISAGPPGGF